MINSILNMPLAFQRQVKAYKQYNAHLFSTLGEVCLGHSYG